VKIKKMREKEGCSSRLNIIPCDATKHYTKRLRRVSTSRP